MTIAPEPLAARSARIVEAVSAVVRGKDEIVEQAVIALVAGGHLLLEDIPGVGKTTLAHALARAIGGTFRRVQFTSDLLPSDLVGVSVYSTRTESFDFQPGPLFAHVVLADEINRAPPRTQSALLEAMEEGRITVDGTSHDLPRPFFVLATQNPLEHHGTYDLPESQLDRFLMRLSLGYADEDTEIDLITASDLPTAADVEAVASPEDMVALHEAARAVTVTRPVAAYARRIVAATREHPDVMLGASTRAVLGWVAAARARALVHRRSHVEPDDLQALAVPVLAHRLAVTGAGARAERAAAEDVVRSILVEVPVPT
ncbi:MAG: MoxR family ATPase [Deltaproteobacteria bacterium]|nr:MAG: MoxR family ATPase [Deltaproteobacteria bacterium]